MERLIDFHAPEVQAVLPLLLEDKSTKRNIIWATDPPEELRAIADDKSEITVPQLQQMGFDLLLPRTRKQSAAQQARTRKRGEVNTPAWVCNKMNNALDADWFGLESAQAEPFTQELPQSWQTVPEPVPFPKSKRKTPEWQKYVDSRRMEATCGEAPFLASRYDAATGEPIPVGERIGILDRKLRIVSENTDTEADWLKWTFRALQSVYGYEYQGDSLLLARANLLLTFVEYLQVFWRRSPTIRELKKAANIIAWNLFQMNGLTFTIPGGTRFQREEQLNWFDLMDGEEEPPPAVPCRVKNWRSNRTVTLEQMKEGSTSMKSDYIISNPPYQDETLGDNKGYAPPVYNKFLDACYEIADKVEMIHPARFLFNAGSTPKAWNEKMLNDPHFKVLHYESDASIMFANTEIKGGVVISYHDKKKDFGAIRVFTPYEALNSIMRKAAPHAEAKSLMEIIYLQNKFNLEQLYYEHPEYKAFIGSDGKDKRFRNNIFDKIPCFTENRQNANDLRIIGVCKNKRVWRYIPTKYVEAEHENLKSWKLLVARVNGSGALGEILSSPMIEAPNEGYTQTFIGIGAFSIKDEAQSALKYIKSKFCRTMLGILKITQDNNRDTWRMVPLQDFTSNSDIDWSKSIAEIDQQLYKKYDLSAEEIDFIETHVKEMA